MFFLKDLPTPEMINQFSDVTAGTSAEAILRQLTLLRDASRTLRRVEAYLADHGFSQTQFLTIMVIVREPGRAGLSPAEIADRLDVSRPVLSKVLATMERNGLITRIAQKDDGRRVEMRLRPEGQARFDALLPGYFAALMHEPEHRSDPAPC